MDTNIQKILEEASKVNKQLADEIQKPVLGLSNELDTFFKNEKEGGILLSTVYRFLTGTSSKTHFPSEYTSFLPEREEGLLFPGSFERQREIIQLSDSIRKTILDVFGVKLNCFEKGQSDYIYFDICY